MPASSKGKGTRRRQAGLPPRRRRVPQLPAGRTAERQLRRHDDAPVPVRYLALLPDAGPAAIKRSAHRRDRGKIVQGSDLPPAPQRRPGGAPGRRHRCQPQDDAGRARRPLDVQRRMFHLRRDRQRDGGAGHRPRKRKPARRLPRPRQRDPARSDLDDAIARGLDAARRQGRAATPSASATSWPRCSSCSAPIPEPSGNERVEATTQPGLVLARRSAGPGDPRDLGGRPRHRARRRLRRRRMRRDDHAHLFGLPGDAGHQPSRERSAARARPGKGETGEPLVARLDHRLDERDRQGGVKRLRHRAAGPAGDRHQRPARRSQARRLRSPR
jgi:hypothetical protein